MRPASQLLGCFFLEIVNLDVSFLLLILGVV